jgi:glycosyltransferase involved in cell wall biosynthesis
MGGTEAPARMSVSVALIARDALPYLPQQLDSIIAQLDAADQLVVSVDPSKDATMAFVEALALEDPRVVLLAGPGRGIAANIACALEACTEELIFLSDHDDVWHPDKVRRVSSALADGGAGLVLHDAAVCDASLRVIEPSFFAVRGSAPGILRNVLKNSYIGCCMAFRRSLLRYAMPLPQGIPMHDQWLGLIAEKYLKVCFLPEQLTYYRRHGGNATAQTHASARQMLAWRMALAIALLRRFKDLRKRQERGAADGRV